MKIRRHHLLMQFHPFRTAVDYRFILLLSVDCCLADIKCSPIHPH